MSAPKGYSPVQITLHWAIAVLIVFQLIFGEDMSQVWRGLKTTGVATLGTWAWAHILAGIAVLAFSLWRVLLRLSHGAPDAPKGSSPLVIKASAAVHGLLYVLMFAAPISGLAAWYGGVDTAAEVHQILKPAFIILIAGHVAAALWHQFWLKDGLMDRMRRSQG